MGLSPFARLCRCFWGFYFVRLLPNKIKKGFCGEDYYIPAKPLKDYYNEQFRRNKILELYLY